MPVTLAEMIGPVVGQRLKPHRSRYCWRCWWGRIARHPHRIMRPVYAYEDRMAHHIVQSWLDASLDLTQVRVMRHEADWGEFLAEERENPEVDVIDLTKAAGA